MTEIKVLASILSANQQVAEENRAALKQRGILAVNFIASPGAGKTLLLEKTVAGLYYNFRFAAIEGDITGDADARRLAGLKIPVVQVNTEGGCHLDAAMVRNALAELPLDAVDILAIENVGNLVCPAEFDLGEALKVVILSTPEGDDKPSKYPLIFSEARAVIINKIDLVGLLDFSVEKASSDIRKINPQVPIFRVSAKTGQGYIEWLNWLKKRAYEQKGHDRPSEPV
jgi:hydrogenase nickel incorporation protein HypB